VNEAQLRALTFSHRAARLVMAGVATGLFEEIADTPRTVQDVAAACGLAERGARALLEALVALGVVERVYDAYLATPAARTVLCEKGEESRRHTVLHDLWHTGLWTRLEESLASGRPLEDRSGDLFFTRPDVLVRFFPNLAQAMAETAREEALELAAELALPSCARVLDLGGGAGHFARAIADAHPDAKVVLFDQPAVIAACGSAVHPRVQAVAGDFLVDPLDEASGVGFDYVLLSRVLMALDDARAARLLERVRAVLRPGGVVGLVELRRGDGVAGRVAALLDVDMLLLTGGAVRSVEELRALLATATLCAGSPRSLGRLLLHIEGRA
jgi:SAM-dependent methyltransferase